MCTCDALSRSRYTSRRIEGYLWNLKHTRIGENFVPYVKRTEKLKKKEKPASQPVCLT